MEQKLLHLAHANLAKNRDKLMIDINHILYQSFEIGDMPNKLTKKIIKISIVDLAISQTLNFIKQAAAKSLQEKNSKPDSN